MSKPIPDFVNYKFVDIYRKGSPFDRAYSSVLSVASFQLFCYGLKRRNYLSLGMSLYLAPHIVNVYDYVKTGNMNLYDHFHIIVDNKDCTKDHCDKCRVAND
jgi:hypothetical protein